MRIIFLSLALMLTACGVSPEPDYYMLHPVDGAVTPGFMETIRVERPALPDYLDRPQIVRQMPDNQISIDEMDRWGAPLDTMFEDMLAQDLQQRLPNSEVTKQQDERNVQARFTLETTIENFNGLKQGSVLVAYVTVKDRQHCADAVSAPLLFKGTSDTTDLTDGLSGLISNLADQLVETLLRSNAHKCE